MEASRKATALYEYLDLSPSKRSCTRCSFSAAPLVNPLRVTLLHPDPLSQSLFDLTTRVVESAVASVRIELFRQGREKLARFETVGFMDAKVRNLIDELDVSWSFLAPPPFEPDLAIAVAVDFNRQRQFVTMRTC
jgi:hypothetical protein